MTRTIGAALLAHMQSGATTLAWGLKVTRVDGTVLGWTSHDRPAVIGAVTYSADLGLDVASLVSSAGFAVDNTEINILADDAVITRADIMAGVWDGAAFELFQYNWADLAQGRDVRKVGNFGNVRPVRGAYVAELRGLRQRLQASIGGITQATCRYRLGDARCTKALGAFTFAGTLTHVTSQQVVRDSGRAQAAGYFTAGVITFTSGANDGLQFKVKAHAADGTFTLDLPAVAALAVGNTYSVVAGCTKRLAEDCRDKFNNVPNFGGEPHLPGIDQVTAPPVT